MRSKEGAKSVPPKLKWKTLAILNIQTMELEWPNFSLNLDFGNFETETPNKGVKKMSEERNLIKVLKTSKVSI